MSKASDGFNHVLDMSAFENDLEDGLGERVQSEFKLAKAMDEEQLHDVIDNARKMSDYHEEIRKSHDPEVTAASRLRHLNNAFSLALTLEATHDLPGNETSMQLREEIETLVKTMDA